MGAEGSRGSQGQKKGNFTQNRLILLNVMRDSSSKSNLPFFLQEKTDSELHSQHINTKTDVKLEICVLTMYSNSL